MNTRTRPLNRLMFLILNIIGCVVVLSASLSAQPLFAKSVKRPSLTPQAREALGQLPMRFERNQGQTDPQVKFVSRGAGYGFFLTPTEAVLSLRSSTASSKNVAEVIRLKLEGGNANAAVIGLEPLSAQSHYLLGGREQTTSVANYSKVKYEQVYPGIDLIWYGRQQQLEYDWVVAPGSDPRQIRMSLTGMKRVSIAANGDLVLTGAHGEMRQHRPIIYQETGAQRRLVQGRYVMCGKNQVGFEVERYDTTKPLVIDPYLYFSTYLGGSGGTINQAGMTLDANGNMYVFAVTTSINYPVINALQATNAGIGYDNLGDGYIAKLSADGSSLLFATYLGGTLDDEIFSIAVGADGSIYVGGDTSSPNFPLKNPLQSSFSTNIFDSFHAFVTKLTADGSALVYSTFLGGSGDLDAIVGLSVDAAGNVYATGLTDSGNFPLVNPLQSTYQGGNFDAFVVKINPAGSALLFSTFLGGRDSEEGFRTAVDDSGVYLIGLTLSSNFPTKNAVQPTFGGIGPDGFGDGFLTKLSLDGSTILYSTFLGGRMDDEVLALAVGADHSVYVTGDTSSNDFPLKNPLQSSFSTLISDSYHTFVSKIAPDGSTFVYSTFLGASGDEDVATDIAIDRAGSVYLTGYTNSPDFPTVNPLYPNFQGGAYDGFVTKINPTGTALLFSTFLGGNDTDIETTIRVDAVGNIFLAGITASSNFPTRNPYQANNRGFANLTLTKLGADEVNVGGANFGPASIAARSIVSAFGPNLATGTAEAPSIPLPMTLGGTTVKITDSAGVERLAPIFYVSAGQVNYQIPQGTATGPAFVLITTGTGYMSSGVTQINASAIAIFTVNQSGTGPASALDAITFAQGPFNAKRATGEPNIIAFYGTGLGGDATDQDGDVSSSVQATIDGQPLTVVYAGRAPGYVGLNQLNVLLPANITSGTHSVVFTRNGIPSNVTMITIK